MKSRCVVVGAGLGGIAAALRLRAQGHAVTLVERQPDYGGRARVFEVDGIRYDAGPTVLTAPGLVDELFSIFGEQRSDHVEFLPVAPWYRMDFADGSRFDYGPDAAAVEAEVARLAPADLAGYRRYREYARVLYATGYERYGAAPFHQLGTMLRALPDMIRLRADRSLHAAVSRYIADPRLRAALSVPPLLVGGNPFATPAIYGLIHWLELADGIWFPRGGTGALVAALVSLAARHGVVLRPGAAVQRILVAGRRVTGVALEGGENLPADLVVANADAPAVYRDLLPAGLGSGGAARRLDSLRYSMGLYVLYFSMPRTHPQLAHHTILFGRDFASHIADVFERGRLPEDPSVYLHRPAATDPSMAPPGHDTFYALVPVPNLAAPIDWREAAPEMRRRLLARLEPVIPGVSREAYAIHEVTPHYFADALGSVHGAGFSIAPRLTQSAWFRFHNCDARIDGLYLVGAGTHPGAGVPGVLNSARLVGDLIADRARRAA